MCIFFFGLFYAKLANKKFNYEKRIEDLPEPKQNQQNIMTK